MEREASAERATSAERPASAGRAASADRPFLFAPAMAYRLRRNNNTDTPLPPEEPAGQNPPDGAIIDYYLPADATQPVTLEISTARGRLVRRYASSDTPQPVDPKSLNVPMYWIRQPRALPATRGMHRWVWDLHYPAPDVVRHAYPISAIPHDTPRLPLGPTALPGTYTVKLTVDGRTFTQSLRVRMDPRIKTTAVALETEFNLATKLETLLHDDMEALAAARAAGNAARVRELTALNNDLASVYDLVEGADRAPTSQVVRTAAELEARLQKLR